ncbi:MAG TPA: HDOD domain-containing protein [Clostridia bacterium]|nr:HDOD domain-containing protein [Clostridia bacterium]
MDIYMARQPILDLKLNIYGYELLYRSHHLIMDENDGDVATLNVINNTFMTIGFEEVIDQGLAFLNFTSDLIKQDVPLVFNKEAIVIEILEDVEPEDSLMKKIIELREKGYVFAVDDYDSNYHYDEFLDFVDIVKVDFKKTNKYEREDITRKLKRRSLTLLAEKIENNDEFLEAKRLGYDLFQGFFFQKPQILKNREIKALNTNHIEAINELSKPEPDYKALTEIIKRDVAMTYKFMKLVNSVAFYSRSKIESINDALVRLGFREINKYVFLLMFKHLAVGSPDVLINNALIRAKFSEGLAKKSRFRKKCDDFFLLGMFSMIDVILSVPKEEALREIPISIELRSALTGLVENEYSEMMGLIINHERGNFEALDNYLGGLDISVETMNNEYFNAIQWNSEINKEIN